MNLLNASPKNLPLLLNPLEGLKESSQELEYLRNIPHLQSISQTQMKNLKKRNHISVHENCKSYYEHLSHPALAKLSKSEEKTQYKTKFEEKLLPSKPEENTPPKNYGKGKDIGKIVSILRARNKKKEKLVFLRPINRAKHFDFDDLKKRCWNLL